MNWQAYETVWQLKAPMHIGAGKIGNLQRTRPYLLGRALWGALTLRMTRRHATYLSHEPTGYHHIGSQLNAAMAFTYFYPATYQDNSVQVQWPWENPNDFSRQFISSYASTALMYPNRAAAESTLHEIEFLSPRTMNNSNSLAVYLFGYLFINENTPSGWRQALSDVQFGGERGYGWGATNLVDCQPVTSPNLFQRDDIAVTLNDSRPQLILQGDAPLLAHTRLNDLSAIGTVEPLVGREWQPTQVQNHEVGQHVAYNDICFAPGSRVKHETRLSIGEYGIWEVINVSSPS